MDFEKSKIFFSYARADAEFALKLAKSLRSAGANLWIDQLDIAAGTRWDNAVEQALEIAQSVLVILSPAAVESTNVMDEVSFALEQGKRVVPVLYQVCKIPLRLRRVHHIDFTTDFNLGLERLFHDFNIKPPPGEPRPSEAIATEPPRPQLKAPRPETEPPGYETPKQKGDEPTPPKPATPETQPYEPEPIKLKSPIGKKRPNFLIGAGIALALVIVVGWALWFTPKVARSPETRPSEPQVTTPTEVATKAQEVPKPAVTAPEPQPKPATEAPAKTFTNSIGMKFVLIAAGTFTMGSSTGEPGRYSDEREHPVTISEPFYLQTTEVTQKQWIQVMGSNPSYFKDCGNNCPIEQISWDDAQEFIRRLNQKEGGKGYRLPTEAEWEYACRADTRTSFYTGRCISTNQANYNGNSPLSGCPQGEFRKRPLPVAGFPANPWGLYDMHGNVSEWCQDWYGDYPTGHVTDPTGPASGQGRVLRGGSWDFIARNLRSAFRYWLRPGYRSYHYGFRLARDS